MSHLLRSLPASCLTARFLSSSATNKPLLTALLYGCNRVYATCSVIDSKPDSALARTFAVPPSCEVYLFLVL